MYKYLSSLSSLPWPPVVESRFWWWGGWRRWWRHQTGAGTRNGTRAWDISTISSITGAADVGMELGVVSRMENVTDARPDKFNLNEYNLLFFVVYDQSSIYLIIPNVFFNIFWDKHNFSLLWHHYEETIQRLANKYEWMNV